MTTSEDITYGSKIFYGRINAMACRQRSLFFLLSLPFPVIHSMHPGDHFSFEKIVEEHLRHLGNLTESHPPLLILFSATAGMGKTAVAKKIEEELLAIRITLDEGRILLKGCGMYPAGPEQEKIACILSYFDQLLTALEKISNNRLIVLDDTVDRMYEKIVIVANAHHYPTFLVRIHASKETAIRRIILRERDPDGYLRNIERWYRDYLAFDARHIDYCVDNDVDGQDPKTNSLMEILKSKLVQIVAK